MEETLTVGQQFFSHLSSYMDYVKSNFGNLLWHLLTIAAIFVAAKFALYVISKITSHFMNSPRYHVNERQGKRIDTVMTLTRSVTRYAIYLVAILTAMAEIGLGSAMKNLVVTAGIGSLAIGFGAQNLVRDVVTGLFMMFENQFAVGDYIKTDEADGIVTATAMRVTYLRSLKGDQVIVPNGSISRVVNYTRGGSLASITVSTPYEADTRSILEVIAAAVEDYAEAHEELIEEPPIVQGITAFSGSSVDVGVICKARPMKQWEVERGMRLAVKERFDALGISFPYPHMITLPGKEKAAFRLEKEEETTPV